MKLKAIKGFNDKITEGKEYELKGETNAFYKVTDNAGATLKYMKVLFETIEEIEEVKEVKPKRKRKEKVVEDIVVATEEEEIIESKDEQITEEEL